VIYFIINLQKIIVIKYVNLTNCLHSVQISVTNKCVERHLVDAGVTISQVWNLLQIIPVTSIMANCIKTLGAYYGRPTWFEKVFPSSRPWSVRTVAPPKLTLGTDHRLRGELI
jgi:hypothetical protein